MDEFSLSSFSLKKKREPFSLLQTFLMPSHKEDREEQATLFWSTGDFYISFGAQEIVFFASKQCLVSTADATVGFGAKVEQRERKALFQPSWI